MPDASHGPVLPAERLFVQQLAVDWFHYWLAENDGAAVDRWAYLRHQRDAYVRSSGTC